MGDDLGGMCRARVWLGREGGLVWMRLDREATCDVSWFDRGVAWSGRDLLYLVICG